MLFCPWVRNDCLRNGRRPGQCTTQNLSWNEHAKTDWLFCCELSFMTPAPTHLTLHPQYKECFKIITISSEVLLLQILAHQCRVSAPVLSLCTMALKHGSVSGVKFQPWLLQTLQHRHRNDAHEELSLVCKVIQYVITVKSFLLVRSQHLCRKDVFLSWWYLGNWSHFLGFLFGYNNFWETFQRVGKHTGSV